MAKLHYTKYQENYKNYILDCLDHEDSLIGKNLSREEKIKYLFNRFNLEYGWRVGNNKIGIVNQLTKQEAIAEWLSGLPIHIPYSYCDIIELAQNMGSADYNLSNIQKGRICENYWNFMSYMILLLEEEIKEVA